MTTPQTHARWKPYPRYKDSGVEWLGEIPAHWEVRRLKTIATVQLSNVDKKSVEGEESVQLCNYTDVYYNERITRDLEFMPATATSDQVHRFSLRRGDVLITKDSESWTDIAVPAVVAEDLPGVLCAYHLAHVRPQDGFHGAFIGRAFAAVGPRDQFQVAANGITRFGLGSDAITTAVFAMPPADEQRAIATFLDRETARIDALVAKKERLIELLKEERTVLITRAVTKGLDPSAPTKDSGVEWLGKIPAHWGLTRVKDAADRIGSGKTPSGGAEVYVPGGIMFLRSQNVHFGGLRLDDVAFIDEATDVAMSGSRVTEGDVLLNITGASLGRCCVARIGGRRANVNQHVCVIRPRDGIYNPVFLAAALASDPVQAQIFNAENGISRDALNFEQIGDLVIARPPHDEQAAIAAFLDRETARIFALISKVRDAICRVNELRTALITAAVSGKIDVRREVA